MRHCQRCKTLLGLILLLAGGCAGPKVNPYQVNEERGTLEDVRQLTGGFDRAGEAYFSPDANFVIFQATPKGEEHYQMYIAKLDFKWLDKPMPMGSVVFNTPLPGSITVPRKTDDVVGLSTPVRISPSNSRNTCGYFSPDGNSVIFASTAGKEDPNVPKSGYQRAGHNYIWSFPPGMEIFRADGWLSAIASVPSGGAIDLAKHPLTNNRAYDAECVYSPDGKFIIFTSDRDGDADIYAMHADGSNPHPIVKSPGYDGGAFVSPDGKRIVYRSDRKAKDVLQLYVADLVFDSNGEITGIINDRQITDGTSVSWCPFWHPDGKHIVYSSGVSEVDNGKPTENYELFLIRADGTCQTRLTFSPGADILPVFSPDGKYLMWASRRSADHTAQVFIAKFALPKGS